MTETKLFDLTQTHVLREMQRSESDPLADPQFQRSVGRVLTAGERESQTARLRPADSHLQSRFRRFAAVVALAALLASPAAAMRVKDRPAPDGASAVASVLHPACPAAHGPFGESIVVGARVICRTDSALAGKYELFSVSLPSGAAIRLSPEIGDDRDVTLFAVSPDSVRVAFACDKRRQQKYDLFTASVSGGSAVQVNKVLPADHSVDTFVFSADGSRVVWRQGKNSTNEWALWSAPSASPFGALQISQEMTLGGAPQQGFTAVGDHVHFTADAVVDERYEVWVAKLTSQDVRPEAIFADGFEGGGTEAWR